MPQRRSIPPDWGETARRLLGLPVRPPKTACWPPDRGSSAFLGYGNWFSSGSPISSCGVPVVEKTAQGQGRHCNHQSSQWSGNRYRTALATPHRSPLYDDCPIARMLSGRG